jgi:predicted GNAT family acetyltransferase
MDMELTVVDDAAQHRFEIQADGALAAFAQYRLDEPGVYSFSHTHTMPEFAGHGIATTLIHDALAQLRASGDSVLPFCPFVNAYLRKHPEDVDLVPAADRRRFGLAS